MNNYDSIKFKEILLATFKELLDFLEKEDLKYYVACGTLLGTIRHKGLIPWDDDIDIFMPREDYNKLINLRDKFNGTNLQVLSLKDKNYPQAFAKVVNVNTSVWEYEYIPYITGVWVDIFPLDLSDRGAQSFTKLHSQFKAKFAVYARGVRKYSIKSILYDLFRGKWKDFGTKLICSTYNKIVCQKGLKDFLEYEKTLSKKHGSNYYSYTETGIYTLNKKWFDEFIYCQFEDFQVRVPKGYDEYLTFMYGDYMTPPDKANRNSGHTFHYINLDNRMSLDEIKKEIAKKK